jgi:hypothetical protein
MIPGLRFYDADHMYLVTLPMMPHRETPDDAFGPTHRPRCDDMDDRQRLG